MELNQPKLKPVKPTVGQTWADQRGSEIHIIKIKGDHVQVLTQFQKRMTLMGHSLFGYFFSYDDHLPVWLTPRGEEGRNNNG